MTPCNFLQHITNDNNIIHCKNKNNKIKCDIKYKNNCVHNTCCDINCDCSCIDCVAAISCTCMNCNCDKINNNVEMISSNHPISKSPFANILFFNVLYIYK